MEVRARWALLPLCAVVLTVILLPATASAQAPASQLPGTLRLQTVPPLSGVVVRVDGRTARSDAKGRISVRVRDFVDLERRFVVLPTPISRDRKVVLDRFGGSLAGGARGRVIELGLRTVRLVSWSYVDRFGSVVPETRVTSMRLRSNTGEVLELRGAELAKPRWVAESRTQQGPRGLASKQLYYVVDTAMVDGTSVVNRAGQRFVPWEKQAWLVQLLFFKVSFTATDMFFTRRTGDGIVLTRADGSVDRLPFATDGTVLVPDLPRGTYTVTVFGGGVSFGRPVSISKDQQVMLTVISGADLALVTTGLLVVAVGLVLLGRPHLRTGLHRGVRCVLGRVGGPWRGGRPRSTPRRRAAALVIVLLATLVATLPPPRAAYADAGQGRASPASSPAPVPVLAYYYIWFNPTSWNRAKIDYPLLGRYSSDDVEVMRRHVRMAKAAGITGFLVSWKHTPQLDERLAKLVDVARKEDFRLGIVYQGLDFARNPLPLDTVRTDLSLFAARYASDPVFDIFGKPLVIWNGTDRFTAAQVGRTVEHARRQLLVLGHARTLEDVESTRAVLDGQAYYWSSVDPINGTSASKLSALSRAVHLRGGLWIAPVAPGFDARLLGGKREVPRRDGATLRASFGAARLSQPDALGVISWNEFSENTHIEPSQRFGAVDINVLAELLGVGVPIDVGMDGSAADGRRHPGLPAWAALLSVGAALALLPLGVVLWRRRGRRAAADPEYPIGPSSLDTGGGAHR